MYKRQPPTSVENLRINTLWDGLFHALTWVLTVVGIFLLWRAYAAGERPASAVAFVGLLLIGWGAVNVVEGPLEYEILGIHHGPGDVGRGAAREGRGSGVMVGGGAKGPGH